MWVKDTVDPHITYSQKYIEFEACLDAGLDLHAWYYGRYEREFKAQVIAFFNLRNLVRLHVEDAKAQAMQRRQRKESRGK